MNMPHASVLAWDVQDLTPTLVLIHAFPFDRRMWASQCEALAAVARVITVDLPGFGESRNIRAPHSLDAWADFVEGTLQELVGEEPVAVAGLSMGGYVALRLAERHPGRLEALILADTRAGADSGEGRRAREEAIDTVRREGVAPLVDQLLPRLLSPRADAATVELACGLMSGQSPSAVIAALEAMRDRPDSTAVLADLRVPLLVLVGAADELTPPAEAEAMVRHAPDAWLVKIPGAGHLANLEAPEAFNAAVRGFLNAL